MAIVEPLQAGTTIGGYELVRRIGRGGMAEVWVARRKSDRRASKYVAIKVIADEYAGDRRYQRMFRAEGDLSTLLTHANIVQVFDEGEDNGRSFLVMEWVDGVNLLKIEAALAFLDDEQSQWKIIAYIIGQLLYALKYAHSITMHDGNPLGIVHRDVTPQNVLVSSQGEVKLTDFGVAHFVLDESSGINVKGKLRYMSPEQVAGKTRDPRVDLFAVGAILHELLDGRRFRSHVEDQREMYTEVLGGRLPELTRPVPPELDALRLALLEPDIERRTANADVALDLLAAYPGHGDARRELAEVCGALTGVARPRIGPQRSVAVAAAAAPSDGEQGNGGVVEEQPKAPVPDYDGPGPTVPRPEPTASVGPGFMERLAAAQVVGAEVAKLATPSREPTHTEPRADSGPRFAAEPTIQLTPPVPIEGHPPLMPLGNAEISDETNASAPGTSPSLVVAAAHPARRSLTLRVLPAVAALFLAVGLGAVGASWLLRPNSDAPNDSTHLAVAADPSSGSRPSEPTAPPPAEPPVEPLDLRGGSTSAADPVDGSGGDLAAEVGTSADGEEGSSSSGADDEATTPTDPADSDSPSPTAERRTASPPSTRPRAKSALSVAATKDMGKVEVTIKSKDGAVRKRREFSNLESIGRLPVGRYAVSWRRAGSGTWSDADFTLRKGCDLRLVIKPSGMAPTYLGTCE